MEELVKTMKENFWSDSEIIIIINHFLDGGMLSEIIAPAKNTKTDDEITASINALKRFDSVFFEKKTNNPEFANKLREKWASKKS